MERMTNPDVINPGVLADMKKRRARPDWMSFQDISDEGGGYPKPGTLSVWKSTNRHGFAEIVTMIGGRPRVHRTDWDAWCESRKPAGTAG
jgi:hypothetical protein